MIALRVIDIDEMRRLMWGSALYGVPEVIAFDDRQRCFVWPLAHRVMVG